MGRLAFEHWLRNDATHPDTTGSWTPILWSNYDAGSRQIVCSWRHASSTRIGNARTLLRINAMSTIRKEWRMGPADSMGDCRPLWFRGQRSVQLHGEANRVRYRYISVMARHRHQPLPPVPTWTCPHRGHVHRPADIRRLDADHRRCQGCGQVFDSKPDSK
jgi:hypothetical protein